MHTTTQPTNHQFFYFYHASIVIAEVLGVTMSLLQQAKPHLMEQQPSLAVPEFVLGLFSVVLFGCTIAAFVIWKKKRYPGYAYATPAVYLSSGLLMFALGVVWSSQLMTGAVHSVQNNADPAAIQQAIESQGLPTWLYVCSYATALITTLVTIWVWGKFKRAAQPTGEVLTK